MAQTQEEIDSVLASAVSAIVANIRANCTPSPEAYARGGDFLVAEVANWIENPPEWVKSGWADAARKRALERGIARV